MVARWPLTARSAQLDRLGDWYRSGTSGGALLAGSAGVGKTRLAEELLALRRRLHARRRVRSAIPRHATSHWGFHAVGADREG